VYTGIGNSHQNGDGIQSGDSSSWGSGSAGSGHGSEMLDTGDSSSMSTLLVQHAPAAPAPVATAPVAVPAVVVPCGAGEHRSPGALQGSQGPITPLSEGSNLKELPSQSLSHAPSPGTSAATEWLRRLVSEPAHGPAQVDIMEIMYGILNGLAGMHAAGLAHCDLKPANVLLTAGCVAKIADLGAACAIHSATGRLAVRDAGAAAQIASLQHVLEGQLPDSTRGAAQAPRSAPGQVRRRRSVLRSGGSGAGSDAESDASGRTTSGSRSGKRRSTRAAYTRTPAYSLREVPMVRSTACPLTGAWRCCARLC
jgi:serine/threonine protein kinase